MKLFKFLFLSLIILPQLIFANPENNQGLVTAIVGPASDNTCQFNSIQAAIDSPGGYYNILVVAGPANNRHEYNENIVISKSINIVGGWETCADVDLNNYDASMPKVFINGLSNHATMRTNESSSTINVTLTGLEITGGNNVNGGGLQLVDANTILVNSLIVNNFGSIGGGIFVFKQLSNNSKLVMNNSYVLANTSDTHGGGIYCENSQIYMNDASAVSLNQATGSDAKGGGMFMLSCSLESFAGSKLKEFDFDTNKYEGINYNSATGHGGGIYAVSSTLKLYGGINYSDEYPNIYDGNKLQPVSFNGNHADSDNNGIGDGGAVYLKGRDTGSSSMNIHRGKVHGNTAQNGGAFYIDSYSLFNMHSTTQMLNGGLVDCWSDKCSELSANHSRNKGGATYVKSNATAIFTQTHIENNRADSGTFLASDSTDAFQNIILHQNLIVHNGRNGFGSFTDNNVIDLYNNSEVISGDNLNLSFMFNTITDNYATNSVFNVSGVLVYMNLLSSIIFDQTTPSVANFSGAFHSVIADCVVLSDTSSLNQPYVTRTRDFSIDPGFVYRHYDYHLKSTSLVIDYCDDSMTMGVLTSNDIDDEARVFDLQSLPNVHGTLDIGADEFTGITNESDIIFIDGVDWQ